MKANERRQPGRCPAGSGLNCSTLALLDSNGQRGERLEMRILSRICLTLRIGRR
jgi:hypothetical protein